jgi:ech hydrogenase subunit B
MFLYILLAPFLGGILSGVDRKLTARMQGRVGPPIFQPFYDFQKLVAKETKVVNNSINLLVVMYLIFMVFTGAILFMGSDVLLVVFAFTLAAIFLVQSAYAANSPYSDIGGDRELLQMMAYEPMVLLMTVGFYISSGSFSILQYLTLPSPMIISLPAVFLGYVYVLTIKIRKSPFDLSTSHHAHQEIVKGITTEFSGRTLAMVELAHWYETVILLGFVFLFIVWGSWIGVLTAIAACLLIFFLEIFIDNTFARVKWDVMIKSTWIVTIVFAFLNILIVALQR